MELSVQILCRPELAPAFALAGVPVEAAAPDAAPEALRRLAGSSGVGVVLVEERLHRAMPAELMQRLDRQPLPIIAPFPSPDWERRGLAEEYVLEILRQAIGYRVRPR